ncbi:hypothetical protein KC19_4G185000 [Ceratodon purpureus]|uniref:Uncharacterized protein n=1 Tax=Ceratodon purpureus TaxID=3225 RepID=A0A8T0ICE2_CERPU|nr:hypothetical protein KC19_4G185000 [Ceratodon purpureus]
MGMCEAVSVRLKPCDWGFREWQRSSFWLQYGRVRQHLQACDLLLEQINRCAVPPGGRPEMDMPAGIMRRDDRGSVAARSLCEIPAHVVPESPFDVALDLGFNRGEGVHPTKEGAEGDENGGGGQDSMTSPELEAFTSGGDCCGDGEVGGAGWDEEGSGGGGRGAGSMGDGSGECDHHDGSREWMRGSENVVVDLDPGADATVERGASPSAGLDVGMDMDGMAVARGGEGRVRKRSVGCSPMSVGVPGKSVELAPVNFISAASYYVEGPSKAEPSRGGNSTTRRTSFCRIEAFVIRSRSARAMPVQEEETKRTAAKSAGVDFE